MGAFYKSVIFSFFGYISATLGWALESDNSEGVRIDISGVQIEADRVTFEHPLAHVSGNVHIAGENFCARCEDLEYDMGTKDIHAKGVDMGIDRVYASAQEVSITREQILFKDADIGINAGVGDIIPHMKAEKVIYDRQRRKGIARSAHLKIGKIPLFVPPLTIGDWIRSVDMRFGMGHTSKLGGYFQSETLYNIYKDLRFGLLLDGYGKRGILVGPVIRIDSEGESVKSHLKLRTGHITDRGERGEDIDKAPIGRRRWFIDAEQNHHFGQNIDILSNFLWASDGRVGDDFRRDWRNDSDVRDSFGEIDYRGENYLWTAFTRVKMNRYQDFPQQIPSLRFEGFPQEIFDSGIYYFGYIDFTREKSTEESLVIPGQRESIELNRIDSYWGINRPVELGDGVNFTPLAGGRWTHYGGECDRFLGELGFDFGVNYYAFYPHRVPWLRAKEWKHVLRPVMKYRYISGNSGRTKRPIDKKQRNHFLPCIDLSEMRNVDDIEKQSILRLGIENDFFAKGERGKMRKIAALDFYQDLRFKHNLGTDLKKEKMLSDFYILSELNPRRWLNLRLYSRLDWGHFSLREINAEVNFLSGDLWEFGLRAKFLEHRSNQLGISFCFRFDEVSRLNIEAQIDARSGRFLATEIAYAMCWQDIWDLKFFCKIKNHSSRDGRFQPGFLIDLVRW
ncbi:MAG: LPS-assembly protein LptD [Puniceicoccales bacterium]|nr:LPS-assembly protein LptD [Puniceicoccales bacterium]